MSGITALGLLVLAVWCWVFVLGVVWGGLFVFRFLGFCVGIASAIYFWVWWVAG